MAKTGSTRAKAAGEIVQLFEKLCDLVGKYKDRLISFSEEAARKIRLRLYGKQIGVIGPVAAGKTTMLHVLKDPNVQIDPMAYEKTTEATAFTDKMFVEWKLPLSSSGDRAEIIRLKIRKPKDVGGESSLRDSQNGWIEVCQGSDFLFYLFDASQYEHDGAVANRIRADMEWIADNGQQLAPGFKVVMFANKMDKFVDNEPRKKTFEHETIPSIAELARDALGDYSDQFAFITPCSLLSNRVRVAAISLAMKEMAGVK